MIKRTPTNTLIVTNVSSDILQDPSPLVAFLSLNKYIIELVSLTKFDRILIVCEFAKVAEEVRQAFKQSKQWGHLQITYSIKDNRFSILSSPNSDLLPTSDEDAKDYLELPLEDGSRRFLISPPLSPPSDWDHWGKVEEGPNAKSVSSPQDLSHLLWERLGGFQSSDVRKYQEEEDPEDQNEVMDINKQPEILFEDIDNGVPAIVLDTVNNKKRNNNGDSTRPIAKTAVPPHVD